MENLRNNASSVDLGSGLAMWNEVDVDGSFIGEPYTFPYIKSIKLTEATDEVSIESDGEYQVTDTGKRDVSLEITIMQKDIASLMWHTETMRNKRIQICKQISDKAIAGYYLYWIGAVCDIMPSTDIPIGRGHEMTLKYKLRAINTGGESGASLSVDVSRYNSGTDETGTVGSGFKKTLLSTPTVDFGAAGYQYWNIYKVAE